MNILFFQTIDSDLIDKYCQLEENSSTKCWHFVEYKIDYFLNPGNHSLYATAAPLLRTLLVESSKKIANPNAAEVANGKKTIFDTWAVSFPDNQVQGQPK